MASWTFATDAAPRVLGLPRARRRRSMADVFEARGSEVLLGVGLSAVVAVLLIFLPRAFSVDSWLALVTGREVWQGGLPHHETLTLLAHGKAWIDQQWLSQAISYGIYLLGGLALLGLLNVGLLAGAIWTATLGARRLGAPPRAVMLALPACAALVVCSSEVRTQELVLPLFVATGYLLASDSRRSSRRVYLCLPLLVLWANLHGTASLGALLVALRGLTLAWERRQTLRRSARSWIRPLVLILGGPACLLATPYGLSIVSYYRTMLLGGTLRHAVTEWQPITATPVMAVIFFLLAGGAVWALGRAPERSTTWERLALLALGVASIEVVRNSLFFALLALLVLPLWLPVPAPRAAARPVRPGRRGRLNMLLAGSSVLAALVLSVATLARPASAIELSYQRAQILQVVRHQTTVHSGLKVFADVRFADWLLWRDPSLRGRMANDARFELLSAGQIRRLQSALSASGPAWKQGLRGFRLIVLDRRYSPLAVAGLLREPGHRVLFDDSSRIVLLRSAREASG